LFLLSLSQLLLFDGLSLLLLNLLRGRLGLRHLPRESLLLLFKRVPCLSQLWFV
jgi:hypothetical protein